MRTTRNGPHRPPDGAARQSRHTRQHNAFAPAIRVEGERFERGKISERERAAYERFYHNRLPWHIRAWLRRQIPGFGVRVIRDRLTLLERVAP